MVKIEAILGIEHQAGFEVDSLVRAKEPRRELLSLIVINPGVNQLLKHEELLVYLVAELAGEGGESGRRDRWAWAC